jgi:hypothetical protein
LRFPLELMHPRGWARTVRVLGAGLPSHAEGDGTGEQADLVIVVPTAAECRTRNWLAGALREVEAVVQAGGMAYVLVPRPWRRSVARALQEIKGCRIDRFAHLPNAANPRFIVPVAAGPLRYVSAEAGSFPRWARHAAARLVGSAFVRSVVARWLPSVGLAVSPTEAEPFGWLTRFTSEGAAPLHVVTRPSWRGNHAPLVLHGLSARDGAQAIVAKLARNGGSAVHEREAVNLKTLRDDAISSGARVPALIASDVLGNSHVTVQTPVQGEPVALLLALRPERISEIMNRVVEWLLRWHTATRTDRPLSGEHLVRWLDDPLRRLSPDLTDASGFTGTLRELAERVRGTTIPLVAAHHDLTMSNVLVDKHIGIGVVDWEEAEPHALPLGDFVYAATDVVLTAHGGTRLAAFRACFARGGRHAESVRTHLEVFTETLGLSADIVRLCFDACWLQHARNEAERTRPGQDRPFLEILSWRSLHADQLCFVDKR